MRVALAALLFSEPDLLLLDEPSNHLDLEAALWLESFLKSYRRSLIVVSHERDLLNNVVDHILHVERGGITLYPGNYDAFARLRSERRAQADAFRARQEARPRSSRPMSIAGATSRTPRARRRAGSRRSPACSRSRP